MFQETSEGQTHYENDNCGMPEHNKKVEKKEVNICDPQDEHGCDSCQ